MASPAEFRSQLGNEADSGEVFDAINTPPPRTTASGLTSLRILVADDNEVLVAAVEGLLQHLGHSVEVVTNGREAVEAAERGDFDFVFLDIQMPVMGGFEAARSLRAESAGGRPRHIIGISGEHEDRESYASAGMDDFLLKPIRLTDLARVLKSSSPT